MGSAWPSRNRGTPARFRALAAALVGLALVACGDDEPAGPRAPSPGEVIIPPTTKVMDTATRAALDSVGADGTLYFNASTSVLSGLEVGDVVVSEPTEAAPYGLLRKVVAVRSEGGRTVVETEGALLVEAVHQGEISFTDTLLAEQIESSQALQPGVEARGFTYTLDTDLGTGGRVRIRGSMTITPILDVRLGISCDETFLGICVELPDLDFRTRIGVEEAASLTVIGDVALVFDQEVPIAVHHFAPLTFFIGPVPVVFTPRLTIYLRADGSLTASFDFAVNQQLTLVAGFHYNSDHGFRDLSEQSHTFTRTGPNFSGRVDVRSVAGVRFELLLYGILGPFGSLEAGPHLLANIASLPSDPDLLWRIEGCIWLNVGINSIEIINLRYEKELLQACLGFGQGENRPPSVAIATPNAASQVFQGVPFTLRAFTNDPDDGAVTCRWTSSRSGDPFPVTGCTVPVTFPTTGTRTLTLTGTDPGGKSASASVVVNVQPRPTILVNIASPVELASIGFTETITLSGSASGGTAPYTYTWRIAYPTDDAGNGGTIYTIGTGATRTWKPSDTLSFSACSGANGRLILEATDSDGLSGQRSILVRFYDLC